MLRCKYGVGASSEEGRAVKKIIFEYPRDAEKLEDRLRPRSQLLDRSLIREISSIFDSVEQSGDDAIIAATERFDRVELDAISVPEGYVAKCVSALSPRFREAAIAAIANIREVNEVLMPPGEWRKEIRPGTEIGEKASPLNSVGLWIPATKGPLVSTAMMLVTAAKVAGVKRLLVGMPPQPNGRANPSTVAAANLAGADQIVTGNGVAIIAGYTVGANSIPEVDGIFGPGPPGIAAAMAVAFSYGKKTAIGIGPTDCAIIADEDADPDWVGRNLMCEGEHGTDSSAVLVTISRPMAERVAKVLHDRIPGIEDKRREILSEVFGDRGMGALVLVPDIDTACQFINEYAPEHLMVACIEDRQKEILEKVVNAGEILIGNHTPFSAANYAIGITAVLPTNGFARSLSGITCRDMLKTSTIGSLSKEALVDLQGIIKELGEHEGFPCHVEASRL